MAISKKHKKEFGIYHWDTFDNETFFMGEANTLEDATLKVLEIYRGRLHHTGADQIDVVDKKGNIVVKYRVR